MIRRLIFLFAIFLIPIFFGADSYAMDYSEIHEKYFRYKKRLNYFIVFGYGKGHALLANIRNRDAWINRDGIPNTGDEISTHASITFGQSFTRTGYLLGALSLEYALFKQAGKENDAKITLRQINDILAAFERCDLCESGPPWFMKDTLDGFYIREDLPAVLSDTMYTALNRNCNNDNYLKNRIKNKEYGIPAYINQHQVECVGRYNDHLGYYYTHRFPNDPGINSFYERDEKFNNYYRSQKFTSQDETIGALVGLTLCVEIVEDSATRYKAANIALRMINYLTGYKQNGRTKWWRPRFPDGTFLGNFNGGDARAFAFAFKIIAEKIMKTTGLGEEYPGLKKAPYMPLSYTGAEITSLTAHRYEKYSSVAYMTSQTLAMSGASNIYKSIFAELLLISSKYNWDPFYILLYAAINHKNESEFSSLYDYAKLFEQLYSAPENGTYNYGTAKGVKGWSAEFKWSSTIESQNGERANGWALGNFSGVDFLILHNLACYTLKDYRESFVHFCQNIPNLYE